LKTFGDILTKSVDKIKKDLLTEYVNSGRKATGDWEKYLDSKTTEKTGNVKIEILGADYTYFLENGRKPNKNQNHKKLVGFALYMTNKSDSPISRWIQAKGINESLKFAIAYDLGRKGYKGKPFVSKVINDENISKIVKEAGLDYVKEITTDIKMIFKNGNN
jgi:hypothetical protein